MSEGASPVNRDEITRLLQRVESGEPSAADELLPMVYDELRRLAQSRLASEKPGQTLQATALVHEAYLKLVGDDPEQSAVSWDGRHHFFGAAARAMRQILVDRARRKGAVKHGGGRERVDLFDAGNACASDEQDPIQVLALEDALQSLEKRDPRKYEIVMLRYFAGLTIQQVAQIMNLSPTTIKEDWAFARAWLYTEMTGENDE